MNWLFCDLDGTLAHSIPAMYAVLARFLREFGIGPTQSLFDELNGRSLREIVVELQQRYSLGAAIPDLQARYEQMIEDAYATDVTAAPGATDLLEMAARDGYRLMLVTSGNAAPAKRFVQQHGWDRLFTGYVFGDDVTEAKPAPAIYRLALARSSAAPHDVAVIEDSSAGVRSAKAAGLLTLGLEGTCSAAVLRDSGADMIVSALSDVLPCLSARARA